MPLGMGGRGFGAGGFGSNRRGMLGQKRNNPWGTNNRNRQADEQRRRQREADRKRRQEEKRKRKLEQDKRRQEEKRKQRELDKRIREEAKRQKLYERRGQNGSVQKSIRNNKKVAKVNQQQKRQQEKQQREKLVSSNRKVRDERQYQKTYQLQKQSREKQIQKIKDNKGVSSAFSSQKMNQQRIKHLEKENRKVQIRENASKTKELFYSKQMLQKKQVSDLNSSIRQKQKTLQSIQSQTNISSSTQRNLQREIVQLRQERQVSYFQQEKEKRLFKQQQSIQKQELKVARYEAEKARIEKKVFITPAAKKRQMESMDRYIAKEKGKLQQLKNTGNMNKRSYEIQEKVAKSKAEMEIAKTKIDLKKAELENKFNSQISQARSLGEKEELARKKHMVLGQLEERKQDIVSKHNQISEKAKKSLSALKMEHEVLDKNLAVDTKKSVLQAKIQDYEREYQELKRPPVFETKNSKAAREHMIQKNREQVQTLQYQYEKLEKAPKQKMPENHQVAGPSSVLEEVETLRNTDSYKESKRIYQQKNNQELLDTARRVDQNERRHNLNQREADKEADRLQRQNLKEMQKELDTEQKREKKRKQIIEQENKRKEEEQRKKEEQQRLANEQKERQKEQYRQQKEARRQQYEEQQRKQQEYNRLSQEQSRQQYEAQEQQKQSFSREQKKAYLEGEKQKILLQSELSEEDLMKIAELESEIDGLFG